MISLNVTNYDINTHFFLRSGNDHVICFFLKFIDSLLRMQYCNTFSISSLIMFSSSFESFDEKNIFVSSAKIRNCNFLEHLGRSLMDNKNKSGPRVDP